MKVKLGDLAGTFAFSPRVRLLYVDKKSALDFDVALPCAEPHGLSDAAMVYDCQAQWQKSELHFPSVRSTFSGGATLSNPFTNLLICTPLRFTAMKGVYLVRFLAAMALFSICSGAVLFEKGVALSEPDALAGDEGEGFTTDSDTLETEAVEEPLNAEPEQHTPSEQDNQLPNILFGFGGGIFSSMMFGSLFFEFIRIVFFMAFLTPLIAKRESGEERTAGRILGYVEGNAGIHFSALRDGLGLANGVTAYHLQILEKEGSIVSWRDGKWRRYVVSTLSPEEIDSIPHPLVGTRLAILEILQQSKTLGLTGKEIQEKLSISRQLCSHHMDALRRADFVQKANSKRKAPWLLSENGTAQLTLLGKKIATL